jgi:hypothetical protein
LFVGAEGLKWSMKCSMQNSKSIQLSCNVFKWNSVTKTVGNADVMK